MGFPKGGLPIRHLSRNLREDFCSCARENHEPALKEATDRAPFSKGPCSNFERRDCTRSLSRRRGRTRGGVFFLFACLIELFLCLFVVVVLLLRCAEGCGAMPPGIPQDSETAPGVASLCLCLQRERHTMRGASVKDST